VQAQSLLRLLGRKAKVPEVVEAKIRECDDESKLSSWFDIALNTDSIAEFRKLTQL
jgi:hypothetical protein